MGEDARKKYSRRRFIKLATVTGLSLPVAGGVLAACGDIAATATPAATSTTAATATTAATTAAATATTAATTAAATTAVASSANVLKSNVPGVPDAYLAPPKPFKSYSGVPGRGSTVRIFGVNSGNPPLPRNENKYWQELEKRLGVTWQADIIPSSTYVEKLSVLTAGGDLPDLTWLWLESVPEQYKIIQQGAYTDLTPFLNPEAIKEFPNLAAFPPQLWKNVAIKGKIYGVPRPRFLTSRSLLFRRDWAEKLSLPTTPRNADEFYRLMEGFTKNDPDGNGTADTWGWGFTGTANEFVNNQLFFLGMFRVPNEWKQNADGTLTYYLETAEYREMISYLQRLWQNNLVYPDSWTQSDQQLKDNFIGGKYGLQTDTVTGLPGAGGRRVKTKEVNPNADVVMLVPPGYDGGKGSHWLSNGYLGFTAIPAKVGKDKEKTRELLRILDYIASPFGSEEYNFLSFGLEGVHHDLKADNSRILNDTGKKEVTTSLVLSLTNAPQSLYYAGFPDQPALVQNTIKGLVEIGVTNPALTADSATWTSKGKELNQLIVDRVSRIIRGQDPLTALDTVIKDWKSRGGEQVSKEFAASLKA